MKLARQRHAAGFSLLELVIVIVLISVLLAVGIERLLLVKARTEAAAMDQVLGSLRSAVMIRVAELIVRGRIADVAALAGSNPILRLAERPPNYLGDFFGPDPSSLAPGNWYFDGRTRALCYLVESTEYFETSLPPPARACFVIQAIFDEAARKASVDAPDAQLRGLRVAEVRPFAWRLQSTWPDWPWTAPKARASAAG